MVRLKPDRRQGPGLHVLLRTSSRRACRRSAADGPRRRACPTCRRQDYSGKSAFAPMPACRSAAVGHARSGATCCSPCPPSDVAPGCAAAPDEHTAQAYQARLLLGLRGVTERAPLIPLRARRKEATPRCSGPCDHHSQGCGWPRPSSSTSSSGRNATRSHARSAQL